MGDFPSIGTTASGRGLPSYSSEAFFYKPGDGMVEAEYPLRNKFAGLLALTEADTIAHLTSLAPQRNYMFIKPDEAGNKARSIVTADPSSYLKMKYLEHFIMPSLHRS